LDLFSFNTNKTLRNRIVIYTNARMLYTNADNRWLSEVFARRKEGATAWLVQVTKKGAAQLLLPLTERNEV